MSERLEQAIARLKALPAEKREAIATLILQEDEEFEAIANQLADEFERLINSDLPVLSNYAVSRAGIYEKHP